MKFFAKAPGKIIITGEHFVVHGSFALSAAIDIGVIVNAEVSDSIEIFSKELNLMATESHIPSPLNPIVEAIKATLKYINEKKRVKIIINSELPVASGLGSSSATAVASVAAASSALGYELSKKEIYDLAMIAERITHGRPSGIDANTSVNGGVILYKKGKEIKPIRLDNEVEFIIINSGISRQTQNMLKKFTEFKNSYPYLFNSLVSSSSCLTELATNALVENNLTLLGSLLNFFHLILRQMGVSITELDTIIEKALKAGCIGAKLTGAGGGGCIIALPQFNKTESIIKQLNKSGIKTNLVKIPCKGVKVWKENTL